MAALHRPALPFPRRWPGGLGGPGRLRSGKLGAAAVAALLLGVALLQVNQFSRVTSAGYEINQLNSERAAREADNHALEAEVASLSSLARVDWEARTRLHMEPADRRLYINVNRPLPARPMLPTRFLPPDPPAAAPAGQPFWERVLKLLPFF